MEITHGIALLFVVLFMVIGVVFNKMLWWLLNIGYIFAVAWVAIVNQWELLFFPVLAISAIIAIIAFSISASGGDII